MKIFDNITNTVRDDLRAEIVRGSRVSIAAACFSMYAYQELRDQLASVEEFRFLFTSPTFIREKAAKEKREFYIPSISRETSLYGTAIEVRLCNEMMQCEITKECADWIRAKARFKSNIGGEQVRHSVRRSLRSRRRYGGRNSPRRDLSLYSGCGGAGYDRSIGNRRIL